MMSNNSTDYNLSLERNPALTGSLLGAFNLAIDKIVLGLNNRLPASIVSYDRMANLAQIEILIPHVTTNGTIVPRAQIAAVPVQIDGGGGLCISFPLKEGDLGWIEACDRDISVFLQTLKQAQPNSFRKWSFSDGKFTPSVMKGFTINIQDEDAAVISTLDGTVRISISPTLGVSITAPVINVNGPLALSEGITAQAGSTGGMIFQGNLQVTGFITAGGSITPDTPP